MQTIDIIVFIVYFLAMLGIGLYFFYRNRSTDDYYVGGRNMGSLHIGLSVVATDVGGGFSIGLGGLGFVMGVAGSWMLFTGLIGAWLSAVFLIPRISRLSKKINLLTFPQVFGHFYNNKVALMAGIISAIGYIGFTSSQILAGAKLASATFPVLTLQQALLIMGVIAVVYTVVGGLKAVIYTDTAQWTILMAGLIFIGIPLGYREVGGMQGIRDAVGPEFLSLANVGWAELINWAVTIIPIWFVGMTLYQRIYACRDEKTARRAWYIAGLFEYPVMAFMGVLLGLFARVGAEQGLFAHLGYTDVAAMDSEMGLPLLLRNVLPIGLTGLMLSAYFSAIMSTADSCLMAASGNIVTDIVERFRPISGNEKQVLRISQVATLVIGASALLLAMQMKQVLDLMLLSYAFMVSGLLVPILGALYFKRKTPVAAFWAMLVGGTTTLIIEVSSRDLPGEIDLPNFQLPYGLDANIAGISASLLIFLLLSRWGPGAEKTITKNIKEKTPYQYVE